MLDAAAGVFSPRAKAMRLSKTPRRHWNHPKLYYARSLPAMFM